MTCHDNIPNAEKTVVKVALHPDVHQFLCAHLEAVPRKKWGAAIVTLASVGLAVSKMANASDKAARTLHESTPEKSASNLRAGGDDQKEFSELAKQAQPSAYQDTSARNAKHGTSTAAQQVMPAATLPHRPGVDVIETACVPESIELDEYARHEMSTLFGE